MILKGSQRGGAKQLAAHLLKAEENEQVEVYELDGFIADNLHDALQEIYAVSRGTRCQQFMFSVSLNPPQTESVPIEYFEKAIKDIEQNLGLKGQPRAVVFHEKEGRRHCHAVWSRIDTEDMKAINLPYYKMKLRDVSKELYFHYGWQMPKGLLNKEERNPLNFSLEQWQQAKRQGEDPKLLQKLFQDCWAVSDNRLSFEQALKRYGLYLAKGDRRGYVAIDYRGEVYSLSRWLKVKTKALKERLGPADSLPGSQEVKARISRRMTEKLQTYIHQTKKQFKETLEPIIERKKALVRYQQNQREQLQHKQEERWQKESIQRSQRLPKGIKGIWYRITGKHKAIRIQNEAETEQCRIRDRDEKQHLIERQLQERQTLQRQIKPVFQEHKESMMGLKTGCFQIYGTGGETPSNISSGRIFSKTERPRSRLHTGIVESPFKVYLNN